MIKADGRHWAGKMGDILALMVLKKRLDEIDITIEEMIDLKDRAPNGVQG